MQCVDLHVVAPRCEVKSDEVWKVAVGSSVVAGICLHETLQVRAPATGVM